MRIFHHLIIWITNLDSVASPHTKKSIISWTGRLNYNNGNKFQDTAINDVLEHKSGTFIYFSETILLAEKFIKYTVNKATHGISSVIIDKNLALEIAKEEDFTKITPQII